MSSSIVLIGPSETLPGLKERFDTGGEFQTFTEGEALEALDHIVRTRPLIVALDSEFSLSKRGTALINRIKHDSSLTGCEVRVIAHGREAHRVAVKRGEAGAAAGVERVALDQQGTRRAPRFRIKDGVEITVDGNPAILIDLSRVGAQVVSNTVLKPNQRVRLIIGDGKNAIRCAGAFAWAAFEMPKGLPPRYRGGVNFLAPDAVAIDAFTHKNKV